MRGGNYCERVFHERQNWLHPRGFGVLLYRAVQSNVFDSVLHACTESKSCPCRNHPADHKNLGCNQCPLLIECFITIENSLSTVSTKSECSSSAVSASCFRSVIPQQEKFPSPTAVIMFPQIGHT